MAISVPLGVVAVLVYAVASLIDEPLRRYTEAKMNRELKGYTARIKALRNMKIYSSAQEEGKPFFRKMYEGLVGGVATLLENRARDEVATKAQVSGRTDDPQVSVGDVVSRLLQNAFVKAIRPGFDRDGTQTERAKQ